MIDDDDEDYDDDEDEEDDADEAHDEDDADEDDDIIAASEVSSWSDLPMLQRGSKLWAVIVHITKAWWPIQTWFIIYIV